MKISIVRIDKKKAVHLQVKPLEWLSPTTIYESLRRIPGSGLKVNGVATFGRYLWNLPELKHDRITKGRIYLVKKKKELPT